MADTKAEFTLKPLLADNERNSSLLSPFLLHSGYDTCGVAEELQAESAGQGWLGKKLDWAKCTLGSSANNRAWYDPRTMWSCLLDWDSSSVAVESALRDQAMSKWKGVPSAGTDARTALERYKASQKTGVDGVADVGAGIAATFAIMHRPTGLTQAMIRGALLGGISKVMLKASDRKYADAPRDLLTGAVFGGLCPLAEKAGVQFSEIAANRLGLELTGELLAKRIQTQGASLSIKFLSNAAKSGTTWGVFGAIHSPFRELCKAQEEHRSVTAGNLLYRAVVGGATGFVGGTMFNMGIEWVAGQRRAMLLRKLDLDDSLSPYVAPVRRRNL